MNICYNMDCAELLCQLPDKEKNKRMVLAIVDPEYGIGADKGFSGCDGFRGKGKKIQRRQYYKEWDKKPPSIEYFKSLIKVSKYQIIFGGNFFTDKLPVNGHWIFWDKLNTMPTFSDGELLWTSFKRNNVKKIVINNNGLMAEEKDRIHPTQKPRKLYRWLLTNYAKPGWLILDTHVGSGSIRIACHDLGFDFIGTENDYDYWQAQEKRYWDYIAQGELPGMGEEIQESIFKQGEL